MYSIPVTWNIYIYKYNQIYNYINGCLSLSWMIPKTLLGKMFVFHPGHPFKNWLFRVQRISHRIWWFSKKSPCYIPISPGNPPRKKNGKRQMQNPKAKKTPKAKEIWCLIQMIFLFQNGFFQLPNPVPTASMGLVYSPTNLPKNQPKVGR